jgi:ElaB/YqjD/DUF883 family membrane-anchored ribosome-binding protein
LFYNKGKGGDYGLAKEKSRDFDADVTINRFKLDVGNEEQASIYHYWSELAAKAEAQQDDLEDELDLILAKVDEEIRQTAEKKDEKITEPLVKNRIQKHPKVLQAKERLREAKANVYTLKAAVKSLEHRKGSLDNLTTLWCKNYYSSPSGIPAESGNDAAGHDLRKNLNDKKKEKKRNG